MTGALLTFLMMFVLCVITLVIGIALIMVIMYFTIGYIVRNFGNPTREEEFNKEKK